MAQFLASLILVVNVYLRSSVVSGQKSIHCRSLSFSGLSASPRSEWYTPVTFPTRSSLPETSGIIVASNTPWCRSAAYSIVRRQSILSTANTGLPNRVSFISCSVTNQPTPLRIGSVSCRTCRFVTMTTSRLQNKVDGIPSGLEACILKVRCIGNYVTVSAAPLLRNCDNNGSSIRLVSEPKSAHTVAL